VYDRQCAASEKPWWAPPSGGSAPAGPSRAYLELGGGQHRAQAQFGGRPGQAGQRQRLRLVGAGWNEPEYQAFGLPFEHRVSRFQEALQTVQ